MHFRASEVQAAKAMLVFHLGLCVAFASGCHEKEAARPDAAPEVTPIATAASPKEAPSQAQTSLPAVPQKRERTGKLDATFFVASDTHLGFNTPPAEGRDIVAQPLGVEATNLRMIRSMNELPGKAWPSTLGGVVSSPRGVIITGDLTENGGKEEWAMFDTMYGRSAAGGPLKFPVYEAAGNHDRVINWVVREQVAKRHGGRFYSFDWDDLHLICLGEAPDAAGIEFLKKDLLTIAQDVPVVLYLHFPLTGPFSENWWSRQDGPAKLEKAIAGFNIVGIFHGHYHASGAYRWKGYDVYNVGSPKYIFHSYVAVSITDERLVLGSYNYDLSAWWWWHEKPINQGVSKRRSWVRQAPAGEAQPRLDL